MTRWNNSYFFSFIAENIIGVGSGYMSTMVVVIERDTFAVTCCIACKLVDGGVLIASVGFNETLSLEPAATATICNGMEGYILSMILWMMFFNVSGTPPFCWNSYETFWSLHSTHTALVWAHQDQVLQIETWCGISPCNNLTCLIYNFTAGLFCNPRSWQ